MPPPPRIVSTLASGTEILFALGLGDRLVAVSHECDHPPAVHELPRITRTRIDPAAASSDIDRQVRELSAKGESLYEIDAERLTALVPELIVTQSHCDVCAVSGRDVRRTLDAIPTLRAAEIVELNPTTLDGLFDDVRRVGLATGCNSRATDVVAAMQNRVEAVARVTHTLDEASRPRTACIEWIDPISLAANWMPDLLRIAGGRCEVVSPGVRSGFTDWETVADFQPEVIVVMPCGFDLPRTIEEAGVLETRPGWADLPAVRHGRVWAVDGNAYFNRSGPRLIDSLEILACLLHPERFPQFASLCDRVARRL